MTSPDVAIVGGGIVGAACAEALAREGARVLLFEAADAGSSGATAAGMGHIVAMDDSEAQFALTAYSRRLWSERAPVPFEAAGTLWVAADEEEMAAVRSKHAYYTARGQGAEILDARALAAAEPNLRAGLAGALLVPDDRVVYAPRAAAWLAARAIEHRAEVREGVEVIAVEPGSVLLADGLRVSVGLVVVAAGSASIRLVPGLAMRPRKGHLAITDRYPGLVRHQLVELGYLKSAHGHARESVAFNLQPRSTGQVLIGSSRQYDTERADVEAPLLARMIARAIEYVPGLAPLSILRAWTGFRAATPDSLPLIGPVAPALWVCTGHEGLGITTSLASAELIAARFTGRAAAIDPAPYLPTRFDDGSNHAHH